MNKHLQQVLSTVVGAQQKRKAFLVLMKFLVEERGDQNQCWVTALLYITLTKYSYLMCLLSFSLTP